MMSHDPVESYVQDLASCVKMEDDFLKRMSQGSKPIAGFARMMAISSIRPQLMAQHNMADATDIKYMRAGIRSGLTGVDALIRGTEIILQLKPFKK